MGVAADAPGVSPRTRTSPEWSPERRNCGALAAAQGLRARAAKSGFRALERVASSLQSTPA